VKVRLLEGRYQDGEPFANVVGDVIDVDADEARRLIEAGSAEPVARKQSDQRETRTAA
jgi:hypothetical protein